MLVFGNSLTQAEQTNLKVRILPIDCLFEVIDVGTQQLRYLTPETCPIDEVPTPPKKKSQIKSLEIQSPLNDQTTFQITIKKILNSHLLKSTRNLR